MRRFWQGSPDHRGTPEAPGRVVTLVPETGHQCWGVAYELDGRTTSEIITELDIREQGGYERDNVTVITPQGKLPALVYVARPSNESWLGPAPTNLMASHIASCEGPSGSNAQYLFELADSLREMGVDDPHVFELDSAVRSLLTTQ